MYRFLDKRFYHKSRWEFDLTEFACEHIGVSRNYDTGQLKRRLQPAIEELGSGRVSRSPARGAALRENLSRRVADCLHQKSSSANRTAKSRRRSSHQTTVRSRRDAVGRNGTCAGLSARTDRNADGGSRPLAAGEGTGINPQSGRVSREVNSRGYLPPAKLMAKKANCQASSRAKTSRRSETLRSGSGGDRAYLNSLSKQEIDALERSSACAR